MDSIKSHFHPPKLFNVVLACSVVTVIYESFSGMKVAVSLVYFPILFYVEYKNDSLFVPFFIARINKHETELCDFEKLLILAIGNFKKG